jgi:hypothetical protein
MQIKRENYLSYSLLAVIVFFAFTLVFLLSFHKPQLVTLSLGGSYRDFLAGNNVVNSSGKSFFSFLYPCINYLINILTFITSNLIKFVDIIVGDAKFKAILTAIILITFPFFIVFSLVLFLSIKLKPERLLMLSIFSSMVISFTFFSAVMLGKIDGFEAALIPLEQIAAYAVVNVIFFTVIYLVVSRFIKARN